MRPSKSPRRRGRPRAFDADRALERALRVFWRKGYEGASLSDLTKAMGINRPSMYAAFGDKEALFRKAIDRYAEGPAAYVVEALKEPTARGAVERMLRGAADMLTDPRNPAGCLMVQGALACGDVAQPIRRELAVGRAKGEAAIRRRLSRAKTEGDLPQHSNPADLARYVATMVYGMAVQAAGGASRGALRGLAEAAMRAWPAPD
jgi:AcrR family transcriptional regulator